MAYSPPPPLYGGELHEDSPLSPPTASASRREGWKGYGGSPYVQLAGGWAEAHRAPHEPKDGSIHAVFARPDERPAVPSDRTLTPAELRAHIVRWVAENNRPLAIVEDREFKTILGAGRPEFNLPGRRTVSRDLNVSFGVSRAFIEELLKTILGWGFSAKSRSKDSGNSITFEATYCFHLVNSTPRIPESNFWM
ncbi:hypothetical protein B0H10DRAFT_2203021 [Mycena sp. CBHHK59/15]|nr:hypothetical protein B0H10DRAFT_2203021 [Mycena sp. CBHHK59/15]